MLARSSKLHKGLLKKSLPFTIFLVGMITTAVVISSQIKNQQELVRQHTNTAAKQTRIRLEEFMESHLSCLDVMAKRWVQHPNFSRDRFLQFAELYYENYSGFQAINWVNPEGIICWVYPEEPNRRAIGMDIHEHPNLKCRAAFINVEKTQSFGLTPCMDLFQGEKGFAADWPLIHNGKLQGYLNGVFRIRSLIDICLAKGVFDDFCLNIYEADQLIYQRKGENDDAKCKKWFAVETIRFRDKKWRLELKPKAKLYSAVTLASNLPLFLFGLVASISVGFLIFCLIRRGDQYRFTFEKSMLAEESLIESEKRYRTMIENANDMIWTLDTQGNLTFFNQQAEVVSGHNMKEWKGKSFVPLIYPDDLEIVNDVFEKTLTGKSQHYMVRIVTKDGPILTLSVNTAPIFEKGEVIGTVSFGRDITARIQAEKELEKSFNKMKKITEDVVKAMAVVVEMKDPYTAGHQRRVAMLACAIAKEMGLSEKQIKGIHIAALLHDIGKILTPHEILNKPGKLTEKEMEDIQKHPQIGSNILSSIEFDWPIADIVLQHHERINKSGYPQNLSASDIMLDAKIVAVADVVEAMCSARPYRPAYSIQIALDEISKNSGILYDPEVANICITIFTEKHFSFN